MDFTFHKDFKTNVTKAWSLLLLSTLMASTALGQSAAVGTLSKVLGKVTISRGGKNIPAKTGAQVFETDTIVTESKSAAKVLFSDGSSFMAMENAKFKVDEYKVSGTGNDINLKSAISVGKGMVRFFVKPREGGKGKNDAKFRTANAVMGIRGTSGFIDNSEPSKTKVVVLTGKVEVVNPLQPSRPVMVIPNHVTEVVANNAPSVPSKAPDSLVISLNTEAQRVEPVSEGSAPLPSKDNSTESKEQKKEEPKKDETKTESKKEEAKPEPKKDDAKPESKVEPKKDEGPAASGSTSTEKPAEKPQPKQEPKKATLERKAVDRDSVVFSPVGDKPQLSPQSSTQAVIPAGRTIPKTSAAPAVSEKAPALPSAALQPVNLPDFKEAQKITDKIKTSVTNAVEKTDIVKETEVLIEVPRGPIRAK